MAGGARAGEHVAGLDPGRRRVVTVGDHRGAGCPSPLPGGVAALSAHVVPERGLLGGLALPTFRFCM